MSIKPTIHREGVDKATFKRLKSDMLNTGEFDVNYLNKLDSYQAYWVNETKKTLRDLSTS